MSESGGAGGGGGGEKKPPVPWKTIERVADQAEREELDRLRAMTDEEVDAELKDAGFGPDDAADVLKAALAKADGKGDAGAPRAAPAEPSNVVPLATARQKRVRAVVVASLLAAAAGAAAVIGTRGGDDNRVGAPAPPEPEPTEPEPQPTITDAGDAG